MSFHMPCSTAGAGLARITRVAGPTVIGLGGWSGPSTGRVELLLPVVGGLSPSYGVGMGQGVEGGRGDLLQGNVVDNVQEVLQLVVLGPGTQFQVLDESPSIHLYLIWR